MTEPLRSALSRWSREGLLDLLDDLAARCPVQPPPWTDLDFVRAAPIDPEVVAALIGADGPPPDEEILAEDEGVRLTVIATHSPDRVAAAAELARLEEVVRAGRLDNAVARLARLVVALDADEAADLPDVHALLARCAELVARCWVRGDRSVQVALRDATLATLRARAATDTFSTWWGEDVVRLFDGEHREALEAVVDEIGPSVDAGVSAVRDLLRRTDATDEGDEDDVARAWRAASNAHDAPAQADLLARHADDLPRDVELRLVVMGPDWQRGLEYDPAARIEGLLRLGDVPGAVAVWRQDTRRLRRANLGDLSLAAALHDHPAAAELAGHEALRIARAGWDDDAAVAYLVRAVRRFRATGDALGETRTLRALRRVAPRLVARVSDALSTVGST